MGNRNRGGYSNARIVEHHDGTVSHHQTHYIGYGFSEYQIVGSKQGVEACFSRIERSYPANPYGTRMLSLCEVAPGLWHGDVWHSNTSD